MSSAGMATALTITQLFDSLAIRIDGPRASGVSVAIRWEFTDVAETYRMELSNGALIHYPTHRSEPADLTIRLTKQQLLVLLATGSLDDVATSGDLSVVQTILKFVDPGKPDFSIVTP